jgi:hypothetical protein
MKSLREMIGFVVRDFADFVLHQKKWWVTVFLIIVAAFIAVVYFSGQPAVRPIIYMNE